MTHTKVKVGKGIVLRINLRLNLIIIRSNGQDAEEGLMDTIINFMQLVQTTTILVLNLQQRVLPFTLNSMKATTNPHNGPLH